MLDTVYLTLTIYMPFTVSGRNIFQHRPVSFFSARSAIQRRWLKQRMRWQILGLQAAKRHMHQ